ncbi:hypothetical protein LINGRAHAP2_LOCUS959 [Linum grandiflorum]
MSLLVLGFECPIALFVLLDFGLLSLALCVYDTSPRLPISLVMFLLPMHVLSCSILAILLRIFILCLVFWDACRSKCGVVTSYSECALLLPCGLFGLSNLGPIMSLAVYLYACFTPRLFFIRSRSEGSGVDALVGTHFRFQVWCHLDSDAFDCPSWFFNPRKLGLIDHLWYISLAFGFVLIPVRGGPMS